MKFFGEGLPGVNVDKLTGKLIAIEGADGSGRSTQIRLLTDWLEGHGYATVNVGLKRSNLVSEELEAAMQGNVLSPITFSLFYATDFADQLENIIVPALRAGLLVLADRYIYTLIARDIVRGGNPEWVESLYSIALVPDVVFYLDVAPRFLVERNMQKSAQLDYWESGMDIRLSRDIFDSFIRYQRLMRNEFRRMSEKYNFQVINGNRSPRSIALDLQKHVAPLLGEDRRAANQGIMHANGWL
ncbi:MAG TPA: thymidylate kinase [bacterium]|nr:thymidylate kinase [bacterium]HOY45347.1 thymidylate kinase [bacterium]HPG84377.1 thymidylate kinase [bacterium]HPM60763.1 thymidylate kinase [bacterium]